MKAVIQPFLIPINQKVQHLISVKQTGNGKIESTTLQDVSDKLMLIGDFVKYCAGLSERTAANTINPLLPIFTELWPFLELVLTELIESDEIVEYLCRLVKHS